MENDKKIIIEQKDYQLIVSYIRSISVSFDNIEMATAVKSALSRAILADVSLKEDNNNEKIREL